MKKPTAKQIADNAGEIELPSGIQSDSVRMRPEFGIEGESIAVNRAVALNRIKQGYPVRNVLVGQESVMFCLNPDAPVKAGAEYIMHVTKDGCSIMTDDSFTASFPVTGWHISRDKYDDIDIMFVRVVEALMTDIHHNAVNHGFWEDERAESEDVALVHSEVSEWLEGLREGNPPSTKIPEFTKAEAECADAIIRLFDNARKRGHRLPQAIIAKMAYNASRPYKHGKRF